MRQPAERTMTVEEFYAWDDGTDTRYELAEGVPVAMNPPLGPHRILVVNIAGLCWSCLRDRPPCRAEAEAGIRISDVTQWQADVAVTCAPSTREQAIADPSLIVEVLSSSTREHDLGRKLPDYQGLATVREIWMVDSDRRWLLNWRREEPGWHVQDFVGGSSFASEVLGAEVALDELYRNTDL